MNSVTRKVISNEVTRKRLVIRYYQFQMIVRNLFRRDVKDSVDSLIDWRGTLSGKIKFSNELYRGNSFYGIGSDLRNFAGVDFPLYGCIEHGVYFGSFVDRVEASDSGFPSIVTFGDSRRNHIERESDTPVYEVGPYIAYASRVISDYELDRLHERLGTVLLVFPSHSLFNSEREFDCSVFIDEIKAAACDISADTVLVCVYYQDLIYGRATAYENAGFTVVTAGYREDRRFLGRLKTLITLADYTLSNSVGTHIGYCAYLHKPHKIVVQDINEVMLQKHGAAQDDDKVLESATIEKSQVANAFSEFSTELTDDQRKVCDFYWGFNRLRSPEELRAFFAASRAAFLDDGPTSSVSLQEICLQGTTNEYQ